MAITYREQLLHPNWQRKRLEILQRDNFTCQFCQDTESTLHVHHKQYAKGRLAWEYPNDELTTLCESCHEAAGEMNARLRDVVAKLPIDGPACLGNATGLLAGWAHGQQGMNFEHIYGDEPLAFILGQIASRLDCLWCEPLSNLNDALHLAPAWVVRSAVDRFVAELIARRDDPEPPRPASPLGALNSPKKG